MGRLSESSKSTYPHEWIAKAEWRSTALLLRVQARNEKQAWHRAWGMVAKMFSGDDCLRVVLIEQIR